MNTRASAHREWERQEAPFREYAHQRAGLLSYGQAVPDFALKDETGKLWRLSEVCRKSQLTLVCAFSPDSSESAHQLIDLREADQQYRQDGLLVIGLADATPNELKALKQKYGIAFPLLADTDGRSLQKMSQTDLPFTLLVSPEQKVVFAQQGVNRRLEADAIVEKAGLELTGHRSEAFTPESRGNKPGLPEGRTVLLNDFEGKPVNLPLNRPTVVAEYSTKCESCPKSYAQLMQLWNQSRQNISLVIAFADDASEAERWLKQGGRKKLLGVRYLADPTLLLFREAQFETYGTVLRMESKGQVRDMADPKRRTSYEQDLFRILNETVPAQPVLLQSLSAHSQKPGETGCISCTEKSKG
jgi:peroxiredoxin Q/BCP